MTRRGRSGPGTVPTSRRHACGLAASLVRPVDCARLSFHSGSFLAGFRPGFLLHATTMGTWESWQAKDVSRVICTADPERHGIELSLLRRVSQIEWDNIVLYGEYVLNRRLVRRSRSRP